MYVSVSIRNNRRIIQFHIALDPNLHMRLLLGSLGIGRGIVLCIVVTSSSNIHFRN